jgi:3-methylcrotonyl-CoA carboxylase alpha subunit
MFEKLLIANRGEIACRIMATARQLEIATVAVCSEADRTARHVRLADEAVLIGPPAARESYLAIDRILAAAKKTRAEAIHPGYGFLSENEDFAAACEEAGLIFVGPSAASIRAMGSKSSAKELMAKASVPLVPGYHGAEQNVGFLQTEAGKIGYPVLIKASAGGGGKGMRVVDKAGDFEGALASCKREAAASFGDDCVLLERYLVRPRHIEIQVFADSHGGCISLFERDCSVQRRHQKVLEEAPAPGMTDGQRKEMGDAAIAAARAVGYVGAGTVEFIVDTEGRFYFMEMNTRLQVEHPVTEMITGLDLVEWQLRVAAGEKLPLTSNQLGIRGHAIEARIYAEDPAKGFLPSIGRLVHLVAPQRSNHVRVDTGVDQGDEITPYYDPMIAKLIVWDLDRERARKRMLQALSEYQIAGVANNLNFLGRLMACPAFAQAEFDTGLIERERDFLLSPPAQAPREAVLVAALAVLLAEAKPPSYGGATGAQSLTPWILQDGWRLNSRASRVISFSEGEAERVVRVTYENGGYRLELDGSSVAGSATNGEGAQLKVNLDGHQFEAAAVRLGEKYLLFLDGQNFSLQLANRLQSAGEDSGTAGGLVAPMPGRIVAHLAEVGAVVERGTPLVIMESMKMELSIVAPAKGQVRSFPFAVGAIVAEGSTLVEYERAE